MRIALACPYAWDAPGGVQVHVGQLARRMRDRGHEVLVLAPSAGPVVEEGFARVGRPIRVPFNGSVAPIAPWPSAARAVRRALARFRPDVIHAHEPLIPGAAMFAARSGRAPVVATFHAYADRAALFSLVAPLLRGTWRRISVRIAVSEAARAFVSRRLDGEIRIVPNGIETALFASAEPASLPAGRRILFVNRLDPRKGFLTMVAAFRLIAGSHPDALLVVAGDGRERDAIEMLPASARERVVMLGNVAHADLPPYHAACELFCGPATGRESFGIVLVEAMAAGLPVVASRIPGYDEVVGDDGLLVPPGAPVALADAVRRLLDDGDLAKRLAEAGRRRAARYDWDTVAGEIERIYAEVARVG